MTVTALPNTTEIILSMAATHGMLNRLTTNEAVVMKGMEPLRADGVCVGDVIRLETWIGTLTPDQKMLLIDGEEEEMAALVADSPMGEAGFCVGQLIQDVYEALESMQ